LPFSIISQPHEFSKSVIVVAALVLPVVAPIGLILLGIGSRFVYRVSLALMWTLLAVALIDQLAPLLPDSFNEKWSIDDFSFWGIAYLTGMMAGIGMARGSSGSMPERRLAVITVGAVMGTCTLFSLIAFATTIHPPGEPQTDVSAYLLSPFMLLFLLFFVLL
jgi:hypothetical protein